MPAMRRIETDRRNEVLKRFFLSKETSKERRDERAKGDAHIKDRKSCVAPFVVRAIQLAHHRTDVRLQPAGTEGNQNQGSVERRDTIEDHRIVPKGDNYSPKQDGPPPSESLIIQPAACARQI